MTKQPTSQKADPLAPERVWQTLTDVQMSGLGSLSWLGTQWIETMSDFGSEWLSFVADRVKEDVKTQHAVLHAKDIGEIQAIQAAFLQKAIQDYQAETGKMVKFCADTMDEIRTKATEETGQPKT